MNRADFLRALGLGALVPVVGASSRRPVATRRVVTAIGGPADGRSVMLDDSVRFLRVPVPAPDGWGAYVYERDPLDPTKMV